MPADEGVPTVATAIDTRSVLDALPRAVVVTDLDGRIVAWNRGAAAMYRWDADEAIGSQVEDLLRVAGHREAHPVPSEVAMAWSGDVAIVRKDGRAVQTFMFVRPVHDDDGTVVGVLRAADDVTETRALEQEARDVHEHLRLALAAGELGTWRWDRDTGVVVWDEAMARMFGMDPETFGGTIDAWAATVHPDDRARCLATIEHAVETRSAYVLEHRVVLADGQLRWVQGRGQVTLAPDGHVTGTIGCAGDVTARKELELAAARRTADAEWAASLERAQRRRLEFLVRLNDLALGRCDHRELMRDLAAAAVPQLGDWCTIHFVNQPSEPPDVEVAHADPERTAWARDLLARYPILPDAPFGPGAVIRTGEIEHVPDVDATMISSILTAWPQRGDPGELRQVLDVLRPRSSITAPLRSGRGVIGALRILTTDESGRRLDGDDVALVRAAAGRIAAALDAAWEAGQQRHIAATLQAALLPRVLPKIPGVSLAVRYWAAGTATEVGGDFYDVIDIADDRWALAIGDVCGKGPDAAAVTAKARHTIRAAAMHGRNHLEVLRWLNDALHAGHRELFCTATYATLQRLGPDDWELTSVAAGHPLPLVVRSGRVEVLGTPGTLLGVLPALSAQPATTRLRRGDTIVLYTDGVNDLPPPYGLDDDALHQMVVEACAAGDDAESRVAALGDAIEARLPIARRSDDIALIVATIGPELAA